ncbi:NERD domain-containing protein [Halobacillus locisalis]|uniref:NERD domain-containing protein n=1 Tax=Halobacillus locisalis TaxID=220753 RepID=A0A838CT46_9BACI|nr:nuclease-related domain-containing protein [Halobacillus locisalis]MBA2175114.1 NERD domain-containing protein [Halobacillus locisalis]
MNRRKSNQHAQMEALGGRIHPDHPCSGEITEQILKYDAGFSGESMTDQFLAYLPPHFKLSQNVSLHDGIQHFQMDALLSNQHFLLNLEVKNYKGALTFDLEHRQLFRQVDDRHDVFPDPFLQIEHQSIQLNRWLQRFDFPPIPIYSLVVLSNPYSSYITTGEDRDGLKKKIVRAKGLPSVVSHVSKAFTHPVWTTHQVEAFVDLIQKEHSEYKRDTLQKYQVLESDLIRGVRCPSCSQLALKRKRDHWFCQHCEGKSQDAHYGLLREMALLFGREVTVRNFMNFALLDSRKVAWRLLKEACPEFYGNTKDRVYIVNLS